MALITKEGDRSCKITCLVEIQTKDVFGEATVLLYLQTLEIEDRDSDFF